MPKSPIDSIVKLFSAQNLLDEPKKKLERVSFKEHSHGLHDLHGVPDESSVSMIQKETPEVLQTKLNEMDQEIELLLSKDFSSSATATATAASGSNSGSCLLKGTNRNYIRWLRLLCLRCNEENFQNPKKAVEQLLRLLELQRDFFGMESLQKGFITQKNLPQEDQKHLKTGYVQILSERDRAGRAIMLVVGRIQIGIPIDVTCRLFFFVIMAALLDEEIQKHGFVIIGYNIGQRQVSLDRPVKFLATLWALPMKIAAAHMCNDTAMLKQVVFVFRYCMTNSLLVRFRAHYGTHVECLYILMTFGIPKHVLPIDSNGSLYTKDFEEWLESVSYLHDQQEQKQKQQQNHSHNPKEEPSQQRHQPIIIIGEEDKQQQPPHKEKSLHEFPMNISSSVLHGPTVAKSIDQSNNECSSSSLSSSSSSLSSPLRVDSSDSNSIIVVVPGPMDILIGRGHDGPNGRHSMGYLRLRQLIEDYRPRYESTSTKKKTDVAKQIVKILQDAGCRFLVPNKDKARHNRNTQEQDDDTGEGWGSRTAWTVASDKVARDKISNAFRSMRKTSKVTTTGTAETTAGTKCASTGKRRNENI